MSESVERAYHITDAQTRVRKEAYHPEMKTHVLLTSETYAEKARRLLRRHLLDYHMEKTTTPSGCMFRLTVDAPPSEVLSLLTAERIPYRI